MIVSKLVLLVYLIKFNFDVTYCLLFCSVFVPFAALYWAMYFHNVSAQWGLWKAHLTFEQMHIHVSKNV
jgi:hypothetical protein